MIENAFNTRFKCIVTGAKHEAPAKRKQTKAPERHTQTSAQRTSKLIASRTVGINIYPQSDSDRRATFSKAAI